MVKILHISDTHGFHSFLDFRSDVDMVIHTGDESNSRDLDINKKEFLEFVEWFEAYPIENKIFIAGNHSTFIARKNKQAREILEKAGIIYLEDSYTTVCGLKIFGSPYTPRFRDWNFMVERGKLNKRWSKIAMDTDVILNHGMPKGVMDLSRDVYGTLEMAGDGALFKRTQSIPSLKLFCGGHIHSAHGVTNTGLRIINEVTYSNAAMVKDGEFTNLETHHHGNVIFV